MMRALSFIPRDVIGSVRSVEMWLDELALVERVAHPKTPHASSFGSHVTRQSGRSATVACRTSSGATGQGWPGVREHPRNARRTSR